MDMLTHILWALTIFSFILGYKNLFLIGLFASLPDLTWISFYIWKIKTAKKGHHKLLSIVRSTKGQVKHYLHKHKPGLFREIHYFMHSLFGWLIITTILVLFFKSHLYLSLVYGSHLIIDFPTHSKGRGPVLLYPFSKWTFGGIEFEEHKWLVVGSYALLLILNVLIFFLK